MSRLYRALAAVVDAICLDAGDAFHLAIQTKPGLYQSNRRHHGEHRQLCELDE